MSGTTKTIAPEDLARVTGGAQVIGTEGADNINTHDNRDPESGDLVIAGGGNDMVFTSGGDDQVQGGAGDDHINLAGGNDLGFGGDGNDVIHLGAGTDQAQAGAGNDMIIGADGDGATDLAFGEAGDDMYSWTPGSGSDQFHGGEGQDTLLVGAMTMEQVTGALQGYDSSLTMRVTDNVLTFVDAQGQPQSFSGQIQVGGETLQFFGIEGIRVY